MDTKSTHREKVFAPGTSRNREVGLTFRLQMAMNEAARLEMGARIKKMRVAAGLKQKEIADYCGVELRTYQFWQQGSSPPTGDALPKLSELLRSRGLDYATESYIINGAAGTGHTTPDLGEALEPAWVSRIEHKLDAILTTLVPSSDERRDLLERVLVEAAEALHQEQDRRASSKRGRGHLGVVGEDDA